VKIQLWSDLHLEFKDDWGGSFLDKHDPAAEVLVLAGDITSACRREPLDLVFASTSMRWKHVIFTPGNHEFYKTSLTNGWANIKAAAASRPNVHVLNNEAVTLDGVRFFGGTGWFPEVSQHPLAPYETDLDSLRRSMSDFRLIREFEPAVYMSRKKLADALYSVGENPDVVVTHHLPHERCVSPRYRGDPLNCFFVSDLDVETVGAKLWLHGHTHDSVDVKIGDTRVLANPHGYPRERAANNPWKSDFTVEVLPGNWRDDLRAARC
jgi:Icc-related predicted phosphoesterase